MGIDIAKMRARKAQIEARTGTRFEDREKFKWQDGWDLIAILPSTPAMDDFFVVEFMAHSNIGPNRKFHVCLDLEQNTILLNPALEEAFTRYNEERAAAGKDIKEIDFDAGCPDCKAVRADEGYEDIDILTEGRDSAVARMKYVMPIAHFGHFQQRPSETPIPKTDEEWNAVQLHLAFTPSTVFNGVFDIIEVEKDISSPDGAVLLWIRRFKDQRKMVAYKVDKDSTTLRNPLRYPKSLRRRIADVMAPGKDLDAFRMLVGMLKPAHAMEADLRGLAADAQGGRDGQSAASGTKACFGLDTDSTDPECQACHLKVNCAKTKGVAVPPDVGQAGRTEAKATRSAPQAEPQPTPQPTKDAPARRGRPQAEPSKRAEPPKQAEPVDDDSTPFDEDPPAETKATQPAETTAQPGSKVGSFLDRLRSQRARLASGQ